MRKNRGRLLVTRRRGQVLVWVVVLLPLFLALTGLVFDGGLLWQQYLRARWAASAAAVAAASEIDPQVFAQTGRMLLRPEATELAAIYARRNDPALHVTNVAILYNRYVVVRGWVLAQPVFLSIVGVQGFRIDVQAVEQPAWGASQRLQ